ncbi:unnamed protein product (macronuclear) [Paramecium tetraurelia]|uniref:Uncharacterized protein n=1 Tax=Paramecium tetraurelia TaxID=5888 RepID=A0CIB5_PARTE|nr:uncharacterized protein GSPATT00007667001 [Paramecium tetraurelia]CAK70532.1 unnamed protein product [Paramecium tetraurelia]|eukprot:XP_001437929.1 hypothetical protein (macronuclear) [Paramecium tetraurelia strain d4-2]
MGICFAKTKKDKPSNLIRLIKIENENTVPKPFTLAEFQTKILTTWYRMDILLSSLVTCDRTLQIILLQKAINQILMGQSPNHQMNDVIIGILLELMEKLAFQIEELIREELLSEEVSTKFYQSYTQIAQLSMEYSNWKNNSTTEKTQAWSFI